MKILLTISLLSIFFFQGKSQVVIEKSGSPDLVICNTNAPNTDILSRVFFKTGAYYTGSLATIGTGGSGARLGFFTQSTTDQNAMLERMSILNNGNVGIGTTTPQYIFHVKYNGSGIMQESTSGQARVGFWTNTNIAYVQTHNNIPLHFATNNSSAQLTLTTAGRLGIGTMTPASKLEVKGKTTLVQQAGEDAALEIQGTVRFGGSNPVAFQLTATSNVLKIDHPACNNNDQAIIMVTPVSPSVYDPALQCPYELRYQVDGFWYLYPIGAKIVNGTTSVNLKKCDNTCTVMDVPSAQNCQFWFNQKFNILILL